MISTRLPMARCCAMQMQASLWIGGSITVSMKGSITKQ